jgi:hypothetical protein
MKAMRAVILAAAVAVVGCGGTGRYVGRGIQMYNAGNYENAIEQLDYVRQNNIALDGKASVRWLVYRGLAAAHLHRKEEAIEYLKQGKAAYQQGDPKWLPPEIVTEMDETLKQLGAQ